MNEKDYAELITSYATQGGTFFAIWVSIVSGYLIVAYLAGARLNRSQVAILNVFYLFVSLLVIFGFYGSFTVQAYYVEQLRSIAPHSPQIMNQYVTWGIATASILGVLASLKFMWDIRHPKGP